MNLGETFLKIGKTTWKCRISTLLILNANIELQNREIVRLLDWIQILLVNRKGAKDMIENIIINKKNLIEIAERH